MFVINLILLNFNLTKLNLDMIFMIFNNEIIVIIKIMSNKKNSFSRMKFSNIRYV